MSTISGIVAGKISAEEAAKLDAQLKGLMGTVESAPVYAFPVEYWPDKTPEEHEAEARKVRAKDAKDYDAMDAKVATAGIPSEAAATRKPVTFQDLEAQAVMFSGGIDASALKNDRGWLTAAARIAEFEKTGLRGTTAEIAHHGLSEAQLKAAAEGQPIPNETGTTKTVRNGRAQSTVKGLSKDEAEERLAHWLVEKMRAFNGRSTAMASATVDYMGFADDRAQRAFMYALGKFDSVNVSASGVLNTAYFAVFDPINLTGVGAVGKVAGRVAAKETIKQAIFASAKVAGATGIIYGGATNLMLQGIKVDAGAKEFSITELAISTMVGGILGGTLGAGGTAIARQLWGKMPREISTKVLLEAKDFADDATGIKRAAFLVGITADEQGAPDTSKVAAYLYTLDLGDDTSKSLGLQIVKGFEELAKGDGPEAVVAKLVLSTKAEIAAQAQTAAQVPIVAAVADTAIAPEPSAAVKTPAPTESVMVDAKAKPSGSWDRSLLGNGDPDPDTGRIGIPRRSFTPDGSGSGHNGPPVRPPITKWADAPQLNTPGKKAKHLLSLGPEDRMSLMADLEQQDMAQVVTAMKLFATAERSAGEIGRPPTATARATANPTSGAHAPAGVATANGAGSVAPGAALDEAPPAILSAVVDKAAPMPTPTPSMLWGRRSIKHLFNRRSGLDEEIKKLASIDAAEVPESLAKLLADKKHFAPGEYAQRAQYIKSTLNGDVNKSIDTLDALAKVEKAPGEFAFSKDQVRQIRIELFQREKDPTKQINILKTLTDRNDQDSVDDLVRIYSSRKKPNEQVAFGKDLEEKNGVNPRAIRTNRAVINEIKDAHLKGDIARVEKLMYDHMWGMPILDVRKDYRLEFLLELHRNHPDVPIPEAVKTVERRAGFYAPGTKTVQLMKDLPDTKATAPIAAWGALDDFHRIQDAIRKGTIKDGQKPHFYYGFSTDKVNNENISRHITTVRQIEQVPISDDARFDQIHKSLGSMYTSGPGNNLAILQLAFSIRGKAYGNNMVGKYSDMVGTTSKSARHESSIPFLRSIFEKSPSEGAANDTDVFMFMKLDHQAPFIHLTDAGVFLRKHTNGLLGVGFDTDGKYKPILQEYLPWNLLRNLDPRKPDSIPRNQLRWFNEDVLQLGVRRHIFRPTTDSTGAVSWTTTDANGKVIPRVLFEGDFWKTWKHAPSAAAILLTSSVLVLPAGVTSYDYYFDKNPGVYDLGLLSQPGRIAMNGVILGTDAFGYAADLGPNIIANAGIAASNQWGDTNIEHQYFPVLRYPGQLIANSIEPVGVDFRTKISAETAALLESTKLAPAQAIEAYKKHYETLDVLDKALANPVKDDAAKTPNIIPGTGGWLSTDLDPSTLEEGTRNSLRQLIKASKETPEALTVLSTRTLIEEMKKLAEQSKAITNDKTPEALRIWTNLIAQTNAMDALGAKPGAEKFAAHVKSVTVEQGRAIIMKIEPHILADLEASGDSVITPAQLKTFEAKLEQEILRIEALKTRFEVKKADVPQKKSSADDSFNFASVFGISSAHAEEAPGGGSSDIVAKIKERIANFPESDARAELTRIQAGLQPGATPPLSPDKAAEELQTLKERVAASKKIDDATKAKLDGEIGTILSAQYARIVPADPRAAQAAATKTQVEAGINALTLQLSTDLRLSLSSGTEAVQAAREVEEKLARLKQQVTKLAAADRGDLGTKLGDAETVFLGLPARQKALPESIALEAAEKARQRAAWLKDSETEAKKAVGFLDLDGAQGGIGDGLSSVWKTGAGAFSLAGQYLGPVLKKWTDPYAVGKMPAQMTNIGLWLGSFIGIRAILDGTGLVTNGWLKFALAAGGALLAINMLASNGVTHNFRADNSHRSSLGNTFDTATLHKKTASLGAVQSTTGDGATHLANNIVPVGGLVDGQIGSGIPARFVHDGKGNSHNISHIFSPTGMTYTAGSPENNGRFVNRDVMMTEIADGRGAHLPAVLSASLGRERPANQPLPAAGDSKSWENFVQNAEPA